MTSTKQRQKAAALAREKVAHEARRLAAVGVVLMLFGAAALVTSLFFLLPAGPRKAASLPAGGGVMDPIVITAPRTVLRLTVRQNLFEEGWSYIEGKLQDQMQNVRLEFGGELWHETGADSEGPWSEWQSEFTLNVLVPEPGTYSFSFDAETWQTRTMRHVPATEVAGPIYVVVQPRKGSSMPFRTAGLLALLIGFILHETATGAVYRWLVSLSENKT